VVSNNGDQTNVDRLWDVVEQQRTQIEDLERRVAKKRRWHSTTRGRVALAVSLATILVVGPTFAAFAGAAPPTTSFWSLAGNAGTTAATFLGTTDNKPLVLKTNNTTAMTVGADQNITANGSLNAAGGLKENGTALSSEYAKTDGSNAIGPWRIDTTGNAGSVTNGVYTTGDQTIGGTKTFTNGITFGDGSVQTTANTHGMQAFATSGTWTAPSGVTDAVVRAWGAGGGGGGGCVGINWAVGATGGAGAYTEQIVSVSPGHAYTVSVGTGGTGGALGQNASGGNGGNGGATTFSDGGTTLTSAGGGTGGQGAFGPNELNVGCTGGATAGSGGTVSGAAAVKFVQTPGGNGSGGSIATPSFTAPGGVQGTASGIANGGDSSDATNSTNGDSGYLIVTW
jgi:hypothetical protein